MKRLLFRSKLGIVEAILEQRKTMFRRVVGNKLLMDAMLYSGCGSMLKNEYLLSHSMYKVGDVVAIAQSYKSIEEEIEDYKSGYLPSWIKGECYSAFLKAKEKEDLTKQRGYDNAMYINTELMPHKIRITFVDVEHLNEICVNDAKDEGMELCAYHLYDGTRKIGYEACGIDDVFTTPIDAFAHFIDKVIGRHTWERNPLVYVYSFELID